MTTLEPDSATAAYGIEPNAAPPSALAWSNSALENFIAHQRAAPQPASGVAFSDGGPARRVLGITGVPEKLGAAALYLLGLPKLVDLARRVCGPSAVPSHDWIVIKHPGDGRIIEWHQDFIHARRFPAISVGIHLDDLDADALRIVPGTERTPQDLCALKARCSYDSPAVKALRVPAGGLVWHDVMLVHGSPALPLDAPCRRTYYVEFRPVEALHAHPGFPTDYIRLREHLFAAAQRLHRRLGTAPHGDPFTVLDADERTIIDELRTATARIDTANYCTPLPA